jgi:hypothetical protein
VRIADFFGLGFEVALVGVGEDKVENEKSSLNKFLGVVPLVAQVLSVDGAIQPPRTKVVNVGVIGTLGDAKMLAFESFGYETGG